MYLRTRTGTAALHSIEHLRRNERHPVADTRKAPFRQLNSAGIETIAEDCAERLGSDRPTFPIAKASQCHTAQHLRYVDPSVRTLFERFAYPHKGNPNYDTISFRLTNPRTRVTVYKKDGVVVRMTRITLAADSKSSIHHEVGAYVGAPAFHNITVFEKQ